MYVPEAFREPDPLVLRSLIAEHPFATLVTSAEAGPKVSHIPMYCLEEAGRLFLVGHLAKANDHWRCLEGKSTAVFHGPHAYVSARWYGTRNVVPTWNYVAVHVTGSLAATGREELEAILDLMLRRHEGDAEAFADILDRDVRDALAGHIVGVKMAVDRMEGKWKLSQNKGPEARRRIVEGLLAAGDPGSQGVAGWMSRRDGPAGGAGPGGR